MSATAAGERFDPPRAPAPLGKPKAMPSSALTAASITMQDAPTAIASATATLSGCRAARTARTTGGCSTLAGALTRPSPGHSIEQLPPELALAPLFDRERIVHHRGAAWRVARRLAARSPVRFLRVLVARAVGFLVESS